MGQSIRILTKHVGVNKEKNYEKSYAQDCDAIIGICHGSNGGASWDGLDNVQTWPRHVGHIQR